MSEGSTRYDENQIEKNCVADRLTGMHECVIMYGERTGNIQFLCGK